MGDRGLARRIGTLGVEALGGLGVIRQHIDASVIRDEPTLSAAQALADRLSLRVD